MTDDVFGMSETEEVNFLTPGRYPYQFSLSEQQRTTLDSIPTSTEGASLTLSEPPARKQLFNSRTNRGQGRENRGVTGRGCTRGATSRGGTRGATARGGTGRGGIRGATGRGRKGRGGPQQPINRTDRLPEGQNNRLEDRQLTENDRQEDKQETIDDIEQRQQELDLTEDRHEKEKTPKRENDKHYRQGTEEIRQPRQENEHEMQEETENRDTSDIQTTIQDRHEKEHEVRPEETQNRETSHVRMTSQDRQKTEVEVTKEAQQETESIEDETLMIHDGRLEDSMVTQETSNRQEQMMDGQEDTADREDTQDPEICKNDFIEVAFSVEGKTNRTTLYIGQVLAITEHGYWVSFLRDSKKPVLKVWPVTEDNGLIKREEIIRKLEEPDFVKSGREYALKFSST